MHILIETRPSIKSIFWDGWFWGKGLTARDAFWYHFSGWPECYICGRKRDFVFNLVPLVPYFDNKLVYICKDHGRITDYDCITGEKIHLPLPIPYWQRSIRNAIYSFVLTIVASVRFTWFFVYHLFMCYVWIYPYLWSRNATTHHK